MASGRRGRSGLKIGRWRPTAKKWAAGGVGNYAGGVEGTPRGTRDTEPGHEVTGKTSHAEGPGRRCLELRGRQKGLGPRASSPDLGKRTGPGQAPGLPLQPGEVGRGDAISDESEGCGRERQRMRRAPGFPCTRPLPPPPCLSAGL